MDFAIRPTPILSGAQRSWSPAQDRGWRRFCKWHRAAVLIVWEQRFRTPVARNLITTVMKLMSARLRQWRAPRQTRAATAYHDRWAETIPQIGCSIKHMRTTLMIALCSAAILVSGCATSHSHATAWEY